MPRPMLVLLLAASALAALPVVATAATSGADTRPETQRVVVVELGISASFPADWTVFTPLVRRTSWFGRGADEGPPVYAWSTVFATAGDGRWCDIDRYEDFPWGFDEHATFLERWHVSGSLFGRSGGYAIVDLPAGRRTGSNWMICSRAAHLSGTCSSTLPIGSCSPAPTCSARPRTGSRSPNRWSSGPGRLTYWKGVRKERRMSTMEE